MKSSLDMVLIFSVTFLLVLIIPQKVVCDDDNNQTIPRTDDFLGSPPSLAISPNSTAHNVIEVHEDGLSPSPDDQRGSNVYGAMLLVERILNDEKMKILTTPYLSISDFASRSNVSSLNVDKRCAMDIHSVLRSAYERVDWALQSK